MAKSKKSKDMIIEKEPVKTIFAYSREAEYVGLCNDVLIGTKDDLDAVAAVKSKLNEFRKAVDYANMLYPHQAKAQETAKIRELDKGRVIIWREMRHKMKVYRNKSYPLTSEAIIQAVKAVEFEVEGYGAVLKMNLFAKTGAFHAIIEALRNPLIMSSIAIIPEFATLLTELEKANSEIDALYIKRAENSAKKKVQIEELPNITLTKYRPTLIKRLIALCNIIEAGYMYNEDTINDAATEAKLRRAANTINGLIAKLKEVLAHRGAKGVKGRKGVVQRE